MALSQGRSQYVQRHESVILYDYAAKDIRDTERERLGMLDERMKERKRNRRRWRIPEAASGNWMQVLVSLVVDTVFSRCNGSLVSFHVSTYVCDSSLI